MLKVVRAYRAPDISGRLKWNSFPCEAKIITHGTMSSASKKKEELADLGSDEILFSNLGTAQVDLGSRPGA